MVFKILGNKAIDIGIGTDKVKLLPNTKYYFGGWQLLKSNLDNMGIAYQEVGELNELLSDKNFTTRKNDSDFIGGKVLFTRSGGAGDMLFFSPFLKWLHERKTEIGFACKNIYRQVFYGQPFVQKTYSLPVEFAIIQHYDAWVSARGIIEAFKYNVYDMLVKHLRIPLDDSEKRPYYIPVEEFEMMADDFWNKYVNRTNKTIVVQLNATAPSRTWPYAYPLSVLLKSRGYNVIIFGNLGYIKNIEVDKRFLYPQLIKNHYGFSASIIKRSDLLITPDSCLYHFGEALGIPTLAIFGPFDPEARIKYYKHVWVLMPEQKYCVPCQSHDQICTKIDALTGDSPCLKQISIEMVFEAAEHILRS